MYIQQRKTYLYGRKKRRRDKPEREAVFEQPFYDIRIVEEYEIKEKESS